jgi:hypothetical protein
VDGDHRAEGARQDLEDLLRSPALGQSTIVMHDTMNEEVRAAFHRIEWAAYPHVTYVDLSFTQLDHSLTGLHERWGGLGLVVVDASRSNGCRRGVVPRRQGVPAHAVEIGWRLTVPLRALGRAIRHRVKDLLVRLGLGRHINRRDAGRPD